MSSVARLTRGVPVQITYPYQGITCSGGSECTVTWADDGLSPLLASVGPSDFALYQGTNVIPAPSVTQGHSYSYFRSRPSSSGSRLVWMFRRHESLHLLCVFLSFLSFRNFLSPGDVPSVPCIPTFQIITCSGFLDCCQLLIAVSSIAKFRCGIQCELIVGISVTFLLQASLFFRKLDQDDVSISERYQ